MENAVEFLEILTNKALKNKLKSLSFELYLLLCFIAAWLYYSK